MPYQIRWLECKKLRSPRCVVPPRKLLGRLCKVHHSLYRVASVLAVIQTRASTEYYNTKVETGDVLLKVNGTDVNRFTTREVLKCLRLSSDPTHRSKRTCDDILPSGGAVLHASIPISKSQKPFHIDVMTGAKQRH
ncbi:unnamed protein product [Leptidea sinapis]|uniref:PDZ domain-containing protein n=1 Tax=Leptidea sinapis TaxID=189913 RepID=A0A5E4R0N8_9NEOP|nr:unnamed protein product [Leptidea sinapis]